jgi:hypothetical protein
VKSILELSFSSAERYPCEGFPLRAWWRSSTISKPSTPLSAFKSPLALWLRSRMR